MGRPTNCNVRWGYLGSHGRKRWLGVRTSQKAYLKMSKTSPISKSCRQHDTKCIVKNQFGVEHFVVIVPSQRRKTKKQGCHFWNFLPEIKWFLKQLTAKFGLFNFLGPGNPLVNSRNSLGSNFPAKLFFLISFFFFNFIFHIFSTITFFRLEHAMLKVE